jgi:tRNA/rRNA methyltransferase
MLKWAAQGRTALVFGPEDRGLNTSEIDAGRLSLTVPTAVSSSLNLAQAVMVVAYELRQTAVEQGTPTPRPIDPRSASHQELEGLQEHLKEALVAIGTLPADNPDHFFRPFKQSLEKAALTSRQIRALRGIARQVLWMVGQLKEK